MKESQPYNRLTVSDIRNLRPTFKYGGITMVDWFDVMEGYTFTHIKSGLNHADGQTKSPYHCSIMTIGENSLEECVEEFNKFWRSNHVNKRTRIFK